MKKKSIAIKTLVCVVLLAIASITALFALNGAETALADETGLSFENVAKSYFSGEEGYTLRAFVSKELYENYSLKITYQRVKLNNFLDNVTSYGGECADKTKDGKPVYEILDEKGTVAVNSKSDNRLTENPTGSDKTKYYFELKTNVNCAYIFTVTKKAYNGADDDATYATCYVRKIDDAAPCVLSASAVLVGTDKVRIKIKFTDAKIPVTNETTGKTEFKDPGCARSGVVSIEVAEAATGEIVEKKTFAGSGKDGTASYDFIGEFNRNYDIKLTDDVGNARAKRVGYKNEVYNSDAETVFNNATMSDEKDEQLKSYSVKIQNAVNSAYEKYIEVTRSVNSTDEEKKAALNEFNAALKLYTDAKTKLQNGHKINFEAKYEADGEAFGEFVAYGFESGLTYLPIGDNVTVTLTGTYFAKPNMPKDTDAMLKSVDTDVKNPTEAYRINIRTDSESEGEQNKQLEGTAEIEFNAGDYKKAVAIIAKYSVSGTVTYEKCNLTKLQTDNEDGVVSITVPYTSGVVTLLVERNGNNKLYWLFALTALPLVMGGAMLAYAFKKMKKIKQQAAAQDTEPARPAPEADKKEKPVPANKKKKGKKKK